MSVTVTQIRQPITHRPSKKDKVNMGDKSPKSVHKQAAQKQVKANAAAQKKQEATAAKQVAGRKERGAPRVSTGYVAGLERRPIQRFSELKPVGTSGFFAIADRSLAGRGSALSGIERMPPLLTKRIEIRSPREAVSFNPAP
jgi:hypothetical protein